MSSFVTRALSRRDFLRFGRDATAAVALGSLPAFAGERKPRFQASPFRFGVASGDPLPDGVVLWTRLDADVLERAGARLPVPVRWEIAEDDRFRHIVQTGSNLAIGELGHSVHAEVAGLQPGRHYWYRFMAGGEVSATGRTRTAPAENATIDRFRFAFVSCQNYETGYFTAYRRIAEEDLDLVIHLGDYIYETGTMGSARAVRLQEAGGELFTLDQYRARYASYKTDPDLQDAHASFAFVVTSDDHEVKNDYAGATAPQVDVPPEEFLVRRAAAYQAYYEFMPLRRSAMPAGPNMRLFRRLRFGGLAELHVLDTRQYRSGLSCGGGRKPLCEEASAPSHSIMGTKQEKWLMNGLHASKARWNVLANQVLISRLVQMANDTPTFSMDNWSGYVQSRTRLMRFLAEARPANPVVLTGDIHSNWVSDLKLDFDDPSSPTVGTELVGTAVSSGGDGDESTRADALALNPHFKFYNNRRGYVRCTLTPSLLTSDYRTLPYVTRPDAPIDTRASFVVEDGRPGAQLVKMGDPQ